MYDLGMTVPNSPAYIQLLESGELHQRVAAAYPHLSICDVCALKCPVDRRAANKKIGHKYSKIPDYPAVNQAAVKEMHRQVGDLQLNGNGLAMRGLLVRHLVLPDNLAGTDQIVRFLAEEISANTYLNLMDQYHPAFRAHHLPELNRRITRQEYQQAIEWHIPLD